MFGGRPGAGMAHPGVGTGAISRRAQVLAHAAIRPAPRSRRPDGRVRPQDDGGAGPAGAERTAFEMGDPNVTLAQTMISASKASIGFEATVQVRNKFVEAYKEIMNMPV